MRNFGQSDRGILGQCLIYHRQIPVARPAQHAHAKSLPSYNKYRSIRQNHSEPSFLLPRATRHLFLDSRILIQAPDRKTTGANTSRSIRTVWCNFLRARTGLTSRTKWISVASSVSSIIRKTSALPATVRRPAVFVPARRGSPRRIRYPRRHWPFPGRSRRRCGR
jgi:hypothetical protein